MFEVDAWDLSTEKEEKLLHGLFGEKSKRKRKKRKEKTPTVPNKKKNEEEKGLSFYDNINGVSIKSDNSKKTKNSHAKTTEVADSSEHVTRKRRRKKKSKSEHAKDSVVNINVKEVVGPVTGNGKAEKAMKDKKVENENVEEMNENGSKAKKKRRRRAKKRNDELKHTKTNEENNISAIHTSPKIPNSLDQKKFTNTEHISSSGKFGLQEKLKKKLESSRFRWINEQLYTIPGDEAFSLFEQDASLFDVYHQGFRRQVQQWPINPVDVIIDWVKQRSSSLVLADFGCGEAVIAQSVPNKVHSFDLVAANDRVTACNMAKVPLNSASIDVAIFCLSLMGTDLESFLKEAHRVLKPGGLLKIAEVVSRMETNTFIPALCQLGFKLDNVDDSNKMFILLDFTKDHHPEIAKETLNLSGLELKPCIYKRR
ncbi:ribosomal RNA-processing protein 8 [Exaiptasia diaphana]|uniref:Ribosomal RNA-processing protein 8 n=1 Tax=Exaiptasia diaphana TaxID=2652724 RepID=A0A913XYF8_EXADI|nr:ribosomal RNA-processing protein 8 [Exaiptasia diaphana]KXJ23930.1 Ribosomal RNA-processing protein 8 [Exaiptasia diaphana]